MRRGRFKDMGLRILPVLILLGAAGMAPGQEAVRTFTGADSSDGRSRMTLTVSGTKVSGDSAFDYPPTKGAIADLRFGWRTHYEGTLDPATGSITGTRTSRLTSGGKLLDQKPQVCPFNATLAEDTIKGNWTLQTKQGARPGGFLLRDAAALAVGGTSGLGVAEAVSVLETHAAAVPTGKCAVNVQRALEAGGLGGEGHPVEAREYGAYLKAKGFAAISSSGYKPRKGDIVVVQPGNGVGRHGHIAMFDGARWISDYRETTSWEQAGSGDAKGGSRQFFRP